MTRRFAYVGCRTNTARNAQGRGISVFRVSTDGPWELVQIYETNDPSFLATDSRKRWLYSVEGDGTTISAFRIDGASGEIRLINTRPVQGKNPVHVLISPNDRYAIVCNHLTEDGYVSNLASFAIGEDGALSEAVCILPITGDIGPNRKEQPSAKPHHAQFSTDGETIAMADKGLDEIRFFKLDGQGKLSPLSEMTVKMPWHAGPRHLAYHPTRPFLYVLNELDSSVVAIALDEAGGRPKAFQRISSQSDEFSLIHRAAEIEVSADGRFVYASNRGQGSIGVYNIDAGSGRLTPIEWSRSGGKVPRHFALFEEAGKMFVADEFAHELTQFDVSADGRLSNPKKVASSGSPTCIMLA